MPYTIPEPLTLSRKTLQEDATIKHYKPLSDQPWYKKMIDDDESFKQFPDTTPPVIPRSRPLRRHHYIEDPGYVIPAKRLTKRERLIESILL